MRSRLFALCLVLGVLDSAVAHPEWLEQLGNTLQQMAGAPVGQHSSSSPQSFSPGYQPPQAVQPVHTVELRGPPPSKPAAALGVPQQAQPLPPIAPSSSGSDSLASFTIPTAAPLPTFPPMFSLPPPAAPAPAAPSAVAIGPSASNQSPQYGGSYGPLAGPNSNGTGTREPPVTDFWFKEGTPILPCGYGVNPLPQYNTPRKKCVPWHPMCGWLFSCIHDV